ncbi:DUF350 domain-containing protein [Zavarzinia compransoris]|uniref:DUF350 domain-containing protein n=1 Tax=Zavarzinia compransoris TaxID=1264899 RepID=A0A317E1X1_9PROT|nr:DUF350 domain-containing protein [Zavarzinia compransoris]PWR19135.1 hypothetical protein DKG75_19465 [Zavarzinia compransoris]TDP49148.1 putative membrane protein [Zavarzinia compransoris]
MSQILTTLGTGLPVLLPQLGVTIALLIIGILIYQAITPFNERELVDQGNTAAGIVLGGSVLALAIPLAATLATSNVLIDIIVWGVVALVIQLLTFVVITLVFRGLKAGVEAGNVAAGLGLASAQLAIALLNAGAMAG